MKILLFFTILNVFLIHVNCQKLMWASKIGGTGSATPNTVISDKDDNLYIVGNFSGQIGVTGNFINAYGNKDGFVAKINSNGSFGWIKAIGGTANDFATGIALDGDSIYVTGNFNTGVCHFSTLPADTLLYGSVANDAFLVKYSPEGNVLSKKRIAWGSSDATSQTVGGLSIDKDRNLIVWGNYTNDCFMPGYSVSTSGTNTFIAKLNSRGNVIWMQSLTGYAYIYACGTSSSGYYFGGYYKGALSLPSSLPSLTGDGTTNHAILFKTSYSGSGQWVRQINGPGAQTFYSVTLDNNENIYVGGYYNTTVALGNITIDSTSTVPSLLSPHVNGTLTDLLYGKYRSDGTLQWMNFAGSSGDENIYKSKSDAGYSVFAGKIGDNFSLKDKSVTLNSTPSDMLCLVNDKDDNLLYAFSLGGTGQDYGDAACIDNTGNYIFIGDYASNPIKGPGINLSRDGASGTSDIIIAKYYKGSLDQAVTNVSCRGGSDGTIRLTPVGPLTSEYTYSWSKIGDPAFSAPDTCCITGLTAGSYRVDFHDANNYQIIDTIVVTEPATNISLSAVTTNIKCRNEATGAINLTATGGTQRSGAVKYFYQWSTTNGGGVVYDAEDQSGLLAGNYSVTVTDSLGCTANGTYTLTQPAKALTVDAVGTATTGSDGTATANPLGGTGSYTYSWSNAGNTKTITGLSAGEYSVIVTDANSCKAYDTVQIAAFAVSFKTTNITCNGLTDGTAKVTVTGGSGIYNYTWSQGTPGSTPDSVYNLPKGYTSVTISDGTNTVTAGFYIAEPLALSSSISKTNPLCYGQNTGSVNLVPTGGTAPYGFSWTKNMAPMADISEDLSNIGAGVYSVTIRDTNNCETSNSITVDEPAQLSLTLTVKDMTCYSGKKDGSITSTVTGGTGTKKYLWDNNSTSTALYNLQAGIYSLKVTDANLCSVIKKDTVFPGPAISGNINTLHAACGTNSDGHIQFVPTSSGNGGLTYLWNDLSTNDNLQNIPAGSYSLTVYDSKNCNASFSTTLTPATIPTVSIVVSETSGTTPNDAVICKGDNVLLSGSGASSYSWTGGITNGLAFAPTTTASYTVTGTDEITKCQNTASQIVTVNNLPAPAITGATKVCEGSTVNVYSTVSGMTNYQWNVTGGTITAGGNTSDNSITVTWGTGVTGHVTLNYTNSNGCPATAATDSSVTINPLPTPTISGFTSVCANSAGNVYSTTAGMTNYTWGVSGGIITAGGNANDNSVTVTWGTAGAGNITLNYTNSYGCTAPTITNQAITVNALPPAPTITGSGVTSFCEGGSVTLTSSTGNSYLWSTGATTPGIEVTTSGNYSVKVSDANGCQSASSDAVNVTVFSKPIANAILVTDNSCNNAEPSMVKVNVTSGAEPFHYQWNGGITADNDTISGLAAGGYFVTVTDANNCTGVSNTVTVSVGSDITMTENAASHINITCNGLTNGAFAFTSTGGSGQYEYSIDSINWQSSSEYKNMAAGNYTAFVRDAQKTQCYNKCQVVLTQPEALTVNLSVANVVCGGASTGKVKAVVSGGTPAYSYAWDDPSQSTVDSIYNVAAGIYHLTIKDANQCSLDTNITISGLTALALTEDLTSHVNVTCFSYNDGAFALQASGGSGQYEYSLDGNNWQASASFTSLTSGTYKPYIRDAANVTCIAQMDGSINIVEPTKGVLGVPQITNASNLSATDGKISLTVSGGRDVKIFTLNPGNIENKTGIFTLKPGTYTINVSDTAGCYIGQTNNLTVSFKNSIQQPETDVVKLYPNPSAGLFNIKLSGNMGNNVNIEIYSILGVKVYNKIYNTKEGKLDEKLDLSSLPKGSYILKINNIAFKQRLVIQ